MTTPPVRVERRVGQRFPYLLPVALRTCSGEIEGHGFTQDLSSRGAFLYTDSPLTEGALIELTLRMPSEITLGESMRVRCRGRVLRVVRPAAAASQTDGTVAQTKIGVGVRFEQYEYLTDPLESSAAMPRVSTLHPHEENEPATQLTGRAIQN